MGGNDFVGVNIFRCKTWNGSFLVPKGQGVMQRGGQEHNNVCLQNRSIYYILENDGLFQEKPKWMIWGTTILVKVEISQKC